MSRPRLAVRLLLLVLLAAAASARPAAADAGVPLDRYFQGAVVGLKGKVVTLRYDFSSKDQLQDWPQRVPFPVAEEKDQAVSWFDEKLEIKGSTGAEHKADWAGDLTVSCTLVADADKDLGAWFAPADGEADYATFTLNETYFHKWDGKPGGNHAILKFGKQWREHGSTTDFNGFRYVSQRPPPRALKAGDRVAVTVSHRGGKLGFVLPDFELEGNDPGKRFKDLRAGFYAIKGRVLVDDVVISGRLSDAWLEKERVALTTERPIVAATSGDLDPETRTLVEGYSAGTSAADALVKVVGDPSRPAPVRQAVAAALAKGPRKAVPVVIDLLYSADEAARAHGIGIVKALLGKDYGFNPKGSEESRSAAIRKLNADLAAHPEILER